ncbi:MAG: cupin domain-containing protein [Pseudomonadales bacterium]|nr:cupin domain-containing protein [Pseudomonadales bacterium]
MKSVLGAMPPQQFLEQYWQKKPLLIRGALPGFVSPITPDELAGLACEEEVQSRLVVEKGFEHPWQVVYGPLNDEVFSTLPKTHWTLLVTDIEKHLPELASITDQFRFIPDWRADDLMVSYAPQGGSVGPHWDNYDVFLLRGRGHRRWQISDLNVTQDNYIDGLDLRIMEQFTAQEDWVLEPGDMLYIPPHIAHHGVAEDDCMTFSIGFRAPSVADMLSCYSDSRIDGLSESNRYEDPGLKLQSHSGEIDACVLKDIQALLLKQFQQSPTQFARWFGGYATMTQTQLRDAPEKPMDTFTQWQTKFDQAGGILRSTHSKFSYIRTTPELVALEEATLFVDGDCFDVSLDFAQWLCGERLISTFSVPPDQISATQTNVLIELYNQGSIYFADETSN